MDALEIQTRTCENVPLIELILSFGCESLAITDLKLIKMCDAPPSYEEAMRRGRKTNGKKNVQSKKKPSKKPPVPVDSESDCDCSDCASEIETNDSSSECDCSSCTRDRKAAARKSAKQNQCYGGYCNPPRNKPRPKKPTKRNKNDCYDSSCCCHGGCC